MIYPVSEDTLLLKKQVEQQDLEGKKVLEIGTGNGLIAETMLEKGAKVTASDINKKALDQLPNQIKTVQSDLFESIEDEFDLICFNPPYLPEDEDKEFDGSETWIGGKQGTELTEKFLEEAPNYLRPGGQAFIVVSSLAEDRGLKKDFDLEVVAKEKHWFETLYVMRLSIE